jgi:murein DD-endopeptidase MepM/ murein hydrolase activator NlpD
MMSVFTMSASSSQLSTAKAHERRIERRIRHLRRHIALRHHSWRHHLDRSSPSTSSLPHGFVAHIRKIDAPLKTRPSWERPASGPRDRARLRWIHRVDRRAHRTIRRLIKQRSAIRAWISRFGIFSTCPVRGEHEVLDNFGVIVRIPGVPVHIHEGDDIVAAFGTPVVAPFDGKAVTVPNDLGGLAVSVYGARGYAYNAHLEAYGRLGAVSAGDVIGYVGATGDAGGPHDHFEWHPAGGAAADPHPYLSVVC